MNSASPGFHGGGMGTSSDTELLEAAAAVLGDAGYALEDIEAQGIDLVLAENAYFVVGILAAPTVEQLIRQEALASELISHRLAEADAGPKVWDAYLVLLSQERVSEDATTTRELFEINYDTSRLRRLAHPGVEPVRSELAQVLAPFLRPLELSEDAVVENPLDLMTEALAARGFERELGARATAAFAQGVRLENVL